MPGNAVTMLIFFKLREIVKVKKGLTTSFLFFENAKNLGRSDEAKRR